jgi:stage V sporulation protein K
MSQDNARLIAVKDCPSLDQMVGVDFIKTLLEGVRAGADYRGAAALFGAKLSAGFQNTLLSGAQGTGKTTLAKIVALELRDAGVVSPQAPVMLVNAVELVGEFSGQSEEKTRRALAAMTGGILIVDEIDSLLEIGRYGPSVINALNVHMGNAVNDPVIVATCYAARKDEVLLSNQGLAGRFRHMVDMPPYAIDDLLSIFAMKIQAAGLVMGAGVKTAVRDLLQDVIRAKGSTFANVREVQNILDAAIESHATRLRKEGIDFAKFKAGALA